MQTKRVALWREGAFARARDGDVLCNACPLPTILSFGGRSDVTVQKLRIDGSRCMLFSFSVQYWRLTAVAVFFSRREKLCTQLGFRFPMRAEYR